MDDENYKKIVNEHYVEQARTHNLSISCTMPDLNTRRLEIENIVKYLKNGEMCLEFGCGNGAASVEISKMKKVNLLSIDVTKEMIDLAKQQPREGIEGRLEFRQCDILDFDQRDSFDLAFTIRCIINLMKWDDQRKALQNLANSLKQGGRLILLEAFSDGLEELNRARQDLGLEPISPAFHNLHLEKNRVEEELRKYNITIIKEDNFLSSYYFGTRVIYPALAKANNVEIIKNSKIDNFFSYLPSYGNFSHIKILIFRKN